MGLIDFVVDAGQKLFGGAEEKEEDRASALTELVRKLGFDVDALRIVVEKDVATVYGRAPSQDVREKVVLAIGNTEGISRVDDRLEVVEPKPEAKYYTVKKGDTLSKIAKELYGDPMKYPVLFEANRPMLKDPDKIYPGQVLRIPPLEG